MASSFESFGPYHPEMNDFDHTLILSTPSRLTSVRQRSNHIWVETVLATFTTPSNGGWIVSAKYPN
jgi:hypothetical protein